MNLDFDGESEAYGVCGSLLRFRGPSPNDLRVSQGVGDLPGNSPSATSNVPSGKALMYFELFLGAGVFFIFLAFTMFLPVMVIMPQKFAIGFTIGCSFIIGSFFALQRSKKSTFTHAIKGEASVYSQFHWQHGGDNIFFNGHEELYSLCGILSGTDI